MSNAIIITVSLRKSNAKHPKIKLRDSTGTRRIDQNLITEVDPRNVITWIPDTISGISELTYIELKDKHSEKELFLLEDGSVKAMEGKLQGTIVEKCSFEGDNHKMRYKIGFKIFGDDTEYWSDPVLQMRRI